MDGWIFNILQLKVCRVCEFLMRSVAGFHEQSVETRCREGACVPTTAGRPLRLQSCGALRASTRLPTISQSFCGNFGVQPLPQTSQALPL